MTLPFCKSNTEHRYPYDKCQTKNTSCYSYKRQSGSEFFLKQNIQFIISDKIWTHTKDDKTRNGWKQEISYWLLM